MMTEERSSNNLNINVIKESYMLNTVSPVFDNDIENFMEDANRRLETQATLDHYKRLNNN